MSIHLQTAYTWLPMEDKFPPTIAIFRIYPCHSLSISYNLRDAMGFTLFLASLNKFHPLSTSVQPIFSALQLIGVIAKAEGDAPVGPGGNARDDFPELVHVGLEHVWVRVRRPWSFF